MYTAYFGLNALPFNITPDPHYLYLSDQHREALAHLVYGVNEGSGFILLTGEVGMGKTTLCRCLIQQLPEQVDVALILNPRLDSRELLAAICDELHIHYQRDHTLKDFTDALTNYLVTAHAVKRRTVLILDEAQNLKPEVLEQVRLLTNIETDYEKLLQIILVGQPELSQVLKRKNLRQLAQRITARYHLQPLSLRDTRAYINHRLAISGANTPLFTRPAMNLVYRYSGGIPRLINILCDRALLGSYVTAQKPVTPAIVRKAMAEVRGETSSRSALSWIMAGSAAAVAILGLLFWLSTLNAWLIPAMGENQQQIAAVGLPPSHSTSNPALPEPDIEATYRLPPDVAASNMPITPVSPTQSESSEREAVESAPIEVPPQTNHSEANADNQLVQPMAASESEIILAPTPVATVPTEGATPVEPIATVDAPPVTEPDSPDIATILANQQIASDLDTAFNQLFKLWELDYHTLQGKTACARAATQNLACLFKTGDWTDIRRANRPTVIELVTDKGTQHHAVLKNLQAEVATLDFGGQLFEVPLSHIKDYWLGQFLLLWQPPDLPVSIIRQGMSGKKVLWIRARLNEIKGRARTPENLSPRFDTGLKREIMAFQQEQGLGVDGIVGEQTLQKLDALANNSPRLY